MITIQTNCCSSRQAKIFEEKLNFWSNVRALLEPRLPVQCAPRFVYSMFCLLNDCAWCISHPSGVVRILVKCQNLAAAFAWPLFTSFVQFIPCSVPDRTAATLWLVIWIDFGVCEDHDDWMIGWNMAKCLEWWLVKCLEYGQVSGIWWLVKCLAPCARLVGSLP